MSIRKALNTPHRILAAAILAVAALAPQVAGDEPPRPRLVVVISVDQLRPDTWTRYRAEYTGGLKRLLERGRIYAGDLDYASTQTGPGHATTMTGCRPNRTGIVQNGWVARNPLRAVYCVEDPASTVFGAPHKGRGPRLLRRRTLGDWMKAANPRAKVLSVSAKDRAAILMGGRYPDGAYWLEKSYGGFTTSAYYCPGGVPAWLKAFNDDGWLDRLPPTWTYPQARGVRRDDDPREATKYQNRSPHPLKAKRRSLTCDRLYRTPYADEWTLRLAAQLVHRHDLGGDDVCDLLCISLSATDTVGHLYGPFSQEIHDTMRRLDRKLGAFFARLDRRGAPYVVALTADHGVLPIPDRTVIDEKALIRNAQSHLGAGDKFVVSGSQIWFTEKAGATDRKKLREFLLAQDGIARVITRADLLGRASDAVLRLAQASYAPDRGGDLIVIPKKGVLITRYGSTGTSHGSPWAYDRNIPLVFWGAGFKPGAAGPANAVDLAPTLARHLGVPAPADLDGKVLR